MNDGVKSVFKADKNKTCFVLKKVKARGVSDIEVPKIRDGKYVTVIGKGAFAKCAGLERVVLPDSIARIEKNAFCDALCEIRYLGKMSEWERVVCECDLSDRHIICADGEVEFKYDADAYGTGETVQYGELYYKKNADGKSYAVAGAVDRYARSVTIARMINGLPVTAIARDAFKDRNLLEKIVISEGIKVVCDGAFHMRWALKQVEFPPGLRVIGANAFEGSALETLTVPRGVCIIGDNAFAGCLYLTSAKMQCAATLGKSLFKYSDRLRTAEFSGEVSALGDGVFEGCDKLYTVSLPGSLKAIPVRAFEWCESLKLIKFGGTVAEWNAVAKDPQWDLGTKSFAVECADGTVSKTGERMSAVKMSDVAPHIIADRAYENRTDITAFTVPHGVTEIGDSAFAGCTALTSVILPDGLEEIGQCAFSGSGLTSVHIPASVESLDYDVFTDCADLAEITVDDGNSRYCVKNGCLIDKNEHAVIAATSDASIPTDKNIETIADGAFSGRKLGCSVVIPENITEIGDHAFRNCDGITEITLDTAMISDFAFSGCEALARVNVGRGVKFFGFGVFEDCYALEDMYYDGTTAEFTDIEKDDNFTGGTEFTVHCTDGDIRQ